MLKHEINPAFEELKDEILALPSRFAYEGKHIYGGRRNLIKSLKMGDLEVNVKSFKRPHILNRFIYAWLRKSKAERSYINAMRLLKMKVGTPTPIAYLVYQDAKGVKKSYYISIQQPCDYVLLDLLEQRPPDFEQLFRSYIEFVYSLHQKGIFFIDLSTGNTLLNRKEGNPEFFLVDLNRIDFHSHPLTPQKGMSNFCRLDISDENMNFIITEYARLTGKLAEQLLQIFHYYKRKENLRRSSKKFFRLFKRKKQ